MECVIKKIEFLGGCRLSLLFKNGSVRVVDLDPLIEKGGVFKRFADEEYFRKAQIMEHGYFLEWPDELDIGADSLWRRGKPVPQRKPESAVKGK